MAEREGFALRNFPDGKFARARPRGARLSPCRLKLAQRSGLRIPTQGQAERLCAPQLALLQIPAEIKIPFAKAQGILNFYGEGGIRTLDTLLGYTVFPGLLLQPLGHLSKSVLRTRQRSTLCINYSKYAAQNQTIKLNRLRQNFCKRGFPLIFSKFKTHIISAKNCVARN